MKRILSLLLCLCLLVPAIALAQEADTEQLDKTFGNIFKRYKTTGGVIVVAKGEEILYQRNYGYSEKKTKTLVTEDTYFRVASVSKLISAIHVMQLVEQGLLDLDEDISTYFGYKIRNPYYKNTPITLRHLMTHTSSISAAGGYNNTPDGTVKQFIGTGRVNKNWYKFKPGTKYTYSNFGAGLMGSLVEIVTQKNYNASITESLFDPLNIDAGFTPHALDNPDNITYLYTDKGGLSRSRQATLKQVFDPSVNPESHYRYVAGSLWIKGRDLCRLGMLLCQGGTLEGQTFLKPETIELMKSSQQGQPGISFDSPYGLCVYRNSKLLKQRTVYVHQGMSNGIVACLMFEPESQLVVAVITNGSDSRQDNRMCIINRKLFAEAWKQFGEEGVK